MLRSTKINGELVRIQRISSISYAFLHLIEQEHETRTICCRLGRAAKSYNSVYWLPISAISLLYSTLQKIHTLHVNVTVWLMPKSTEHGAVFAICFKLKQCYASRSHVNSVRQSKTERPVADKRTAAPGLSLFESSEKSAKCFVVRLDTVLITISSSFSFALDMSVRRPTSSSTFGVYLLLILMVQVGNSLARPSSHATTMDDEYAGSRRIRSVSEDDRTRTKMQPGKDQLNAAHLRDTRKSIVKSIVMIAGGVTILITAGGLISMLVYRLKKTWMNSLRSGNDRSSRSISCYRECWIGLQVWKISLSRRYCLGECLSRDHSRGECHTWPYTHQLAEPHGR